MYEIVTCIKKSAAVCAAILRENKPIAVDFEGVKLGRHGELCLVQVGLATGKVIIFDVVSIGAGAFTRGGLKSVLEGDVCKLIFDCRADADALFHLHGVKLSSALDLQILFCIKRDREEGRRDRYVKGLSFAIDHCLELPAAQRAASRHLKMLGRQMFQDNSEIWKVRPLKDVLIQYAAADVLHLHTMFRAWSKDIPEIYMQTTFRVERSISNQPQPQGNQMALKDF